MKAATGKRFCRLPESRGRRLGRIRGSHHIYADGPRQGHCFESCYDCLWKVLKRYLMEELGIADPPNSPKPIFRLANENRLLPSPVEQWLRYADARTGTSHDYDGKKAKACLSLVPDFIDDAIRLYRKMSGEAWR